MIRDMASCGLKISGHAIYTVEPRLANSRTIWKPMPLLPPVTMATLPVRSVGGTLSGGNRRANAIVVIDIAISRR